MTDYKPTHKSYTIVTIDDLYRQLTAEQIPVCLAELQRGLLMAKGLDDLAMLLARAELPEDQLPSRALQFDKGFVWIDDGKTDGDLTVYSEGKEQFRMSIRKDGGDSCNSDHKLGNENGDDLC